MNVIQFFNASENRSIIQEARLVSLLPVFVVSVKTPPSNPALVWSLQDVVPTESAPVVDINISPGWYDNHSLDLLHLSTYLGYNQKY